MFFVLLCCRKSGRDVGFRQRSPAGGRTFPQSLTSPRDNRNSSCCCVMNYQDRHSITELVLAQTAQGWAAGTPGHPWLPHLLHLQTLHFPLGSNLAQLMPVPRVYKVALPVSELSALKFSFLPSRGSLVKVSPWSLRFISIVVPWCCTTKRRSVGYVFSCWDLPLNDFKNDNSDKNPQTK